MSAQLVSTRCLLLVTLGFALAVASGSPLAQQTVVYVHLTTPNPDPEVPWDYLGMRLYGASYDLDFDQDGTPEYTIAAANDSSLASGIYAHGYNAVWAEPAGPLDLNTYAAPLPAGVEIGPDLSSPAFAWSENKGGGTTFNDCMDIGCLGYYGGLDWAYTGLRFVLGGQTHYGWVRVGSPALLWVYDYAYETRPNEPIVTPPVPDPPLLFTKIKQVRTNAFALTWFSVAGRVYQIQHKDEATASTWLNSTNEITARNGGARVTLYVPPGVTNRFYRVVQVR